jgi:Zn-dependent M28 family amino/carboxypeptidase
MTTSNNTNNGSNCGWNNGYGTANWNGTTENATATTNATATCIEPTCGSTYGVNEIPGPGAYVCHWNGSLLRVSDAAFTSGGFTSFNFTSSDPLTVTFLTNDPTATLETCRSYATGTNVYCNF